MTAMTKFRVWAPNARAVAVEVGGNRSNLTPGARGWFEGETPARAGDHYWFILDDGQLLPDPRSQSQPEGVNGPSAVVEHGSFRWKCQSWTQVPFEKAVFYELHVGTFSASGTFAGAIDHLSHLVDLGVTHVELMPVNEFSGSRGWGYDSVVIYAPHHAYGGPEGLKRLVDECHARGLAVIADVVYNHFGPVGNYLERFGPYFTDRFHTPWGKAINLDGRGSDEVRQYFIDHAAMMFRDYRFDGLRLDAIHAIFDMSAIHFLEQLAQEKRSWEAQLNRPLLLTAESDLNDPRVVRDPALGGYGIDAQWSDDFHHALHTVLTGEKEGYYADFGPIADLAKALTQAFVYDGRYSSFRDRRHGRVRRSARPQLSGYLQNHDQVGNRATGDRIGHSPMTLVSNRVGNRSDRALRTPVVSEEWAASSPFLYFTDHQDAALGDAVREGRDGVCSFRLEA